MGREGGGVGEGGSKVLTNRFRNILCITFIYHYRPNIIVGQPQKFVFMTFKIRILDFHENQLVYSIEKISRETKDRKLIKNHPFFQNHGRFFLTAVFRIYEYIYYIHT